MDQVQHQHRASALKQQNKPHKSGRHASKGELKRTTKGRVESNNNNNNKTRTSIKRVNPSLSREERKSMKKKEMQMKKDAIIQEKRNIVGTGHNAPRIVAFLSLGRISPAQLLDIKSLLVQKVESSSEKKTGLVTISCPSKSRLTLIDLPWELGYTSLLDGCKVADVVLLVVPAETGIDKDGEKYLSMLKAQGFPSCMGIIHGLSAIPPKKKHDRKMELTREFHNLIPDEPRVLPLDTMDEAQQVIRFVESLSVKTIHWREKRPYLLVDKLTVLDTASSTDPLPQTYYSIPNPSGVVKDILVSGYLRGNNMSANQLVHLPDCGDFQIKQIISPPDPHKVTRQKVMEDESKVLDISDPSVQEGLEIENVPDPLAGEQTWPTEEDFISEKSFNSRASKKVRVPKGTSEYQAAWYDEDDEEYSDNDFDENESDNESEKAMSDIEGEGSEKKGKGQTSQKNVEETESNDEEFIEMGDDEKKRQMDMEYDKEHENDAPKKKRELTSNDLEFPDEIEVPSDVAARIRFAKYRGLASFRTSPWDAQENLPLEYAKIFQFQNPALSMKRSIARQTEAPVPIGTYVRIQIMNVPISAIHEYCGDSGASDNTKYELKKPLIVGGLLRYENKISIVNFVVQKHTACNLTIASKDEVIFHAGFRRYRTSPIYSQNNNNSDKHKLEKFLLPGRSGVVATVFAPITFAPCPLLVFKETRDENEDPKEPVLVATGRVVNNNPDRIVVKRIILTGLPIKIHKTYAIVRDMFFNVQDINWFKPVELRTKHGKIGHIKESIGTHGHMKCLFDSGIQQFDTVCMHLYKRVFPKWPKVSASLNNQTLALAGSSSTTTTTTATTTTSTIDLLEDKPMGE